MEGDQDFGRSLCHGERPVPRPGATEFGQLFGIPGGRSRVSSAPELCRMVCFTDVTGTLPPRSLVSLVDSGHGDSASRQVQYDAVEQHWEYGIGCVILLSLG